MLNRAAPRWFWICAVLIFAATWFYSLRTREYRQYIIEGDGKGFYLYLPNIFIEKNITHQQPDSRFILDYSGKGINKFFAGTAIMQVPFFFSACAYCFIMGSPIDGVSEPFEVFAAFAAVFYCIAGLFFVRKILQHFKFSESETAVTIFLLAFGTNLFTYYALAPSMSHIYSFAVLSAFFYLVACGKTKHDLFLAAAALGLVVLIRPVNILCLAALPFLCGSFSEFKNRMNQLSDGKISAVLFSVIIFLAIVFIQPFLWYLQSGRFFLWTYGEEGFYFSRPKLYEILFGFRAGFFIYTPLFFFALILFTIEMRRNIQTILLFLLFFTPVIYITAAWWGWPYWDSFGMRPLVDYYSVLALPVAFAVRLSMHSRAKIFFGFATLVCILLNQVQNYQYKNGMLASSGMNYEKYKYSFMNFSHGCFGGNDDIPPYPENKIEEIFTTINDYEKNYTGWSCDTIVFNSRVSSKVCDYAGREYCTLFEVTGSHGLATYRRYFLEAGLDAYFINAAHCSEVKFVVEYKSEGGAMKYYMAFRINELPEIKSRIWKHRKYTLDLPQLDSPGDAIRIYLWNPQKESFQIDNFSLRFNGIRKEKSF